MNSQNKFLVSGVPALMALVLLINNLALSGSNLAFLPVFGLPTQPSHLAVTPLSGGGDPVINAVGDIAACGPQ